MGKRGRGTKIITCSAQVRRFGATSPQWRQVKVGNLICDSTLGDAYKDWDLSSLDGTSFHVLDVPPMSNKEKLALQKYMPFADAGEEAKFLKELPHLLGNNPGDHERRLKRYATLSPYYGYFGKVFI